MDMQVSQLQVLIQRAVEPYRHEPDYAAQMEVAEHINEKKGNRYVADASDGALALLVSLSCFLSFDSFTDNVDLRSPYLISRITDTGIFF